MKAYSEDLRVRVVADRVSGMPTKQVADKYRVSRAWIRRVMQRRRETGSISPMRRSTPPRLFPIDKLPELESLLKQGATAHGWINELWTIRRVAELIRSRFHIELSEGTAFRILTKDLGWSSIKPQIVLRERDEEKIEEWRNRGFPKIKTRADARNAHLVFVDEAGFMLQPTLRRTFAPRGSRPVARISDPHGRISTGCAIAVSPKGKRLSLHFRLLPDNTNFTGDSIASFLKQINEAIRSPVTIIWDSIPIHSSKAVRAYRHCHRNIVFEMIPEYAPELNPADGVWSYIKYGRLANFAPHDLIALRKQLTTELQELVGRPELLASFIAKCRLSLDV